MKKEIPPSNLLAHDRKTELAHLAQLGHVGAFSALFELHKATVYSLCLRTTNSVPDAEQLTQDIFLAISQPWSLSGRIGTLFQRGFMTLQPSGCNRTNERMTLECVFR